nr:hypothetical protein [Pirellula sp.]
GMALTSCLGALQADATEVDDASPHHAEIVLISDLAEGSEIQSLADSQWPEDTVVRMIRATPTSPGNAYFSVLESASSSAEISNKSRELRVRVSNAKSSKNEDFTLVWLDRENKPVDSSAIPFTVAAGSHRVVKLAAPPEDATAIELAGDDAPFDNRRYWIVAPPERKSIFVIEEKARAPEESLAYFLELLSFEESQYQIDVQRHEPGSPWYSDQDTPPAWVVLSHSATMSDADHCRNVLDAGGYVTLVLDGDADKTASDGTKIGEQMKNITSRCTEVEIGSISEGRPSEFAILERFDFGHPVLAPLADPQFNDFSRIRFWQHRRVETADLEGWRVLAWFGDDAPAMLERSVGQGQFLLMTFGWQPTQSQLALSSKFVPMMAGIVARAMPNPPDPQDGMIGDGPYTEPGIYPIADAKAMDKRVAVNVPSNESLTEPMDSSQLSRFGVRLASDIPPEPVANQQRRKMMAVELESRQSWWWWLVSACLVAVGLESMLCWGRSDR